MIINNNNNNSIIIILLRSSSSFFLPHSSSSLRRFYIFVFIKNSSRHYIHYSFLFLNCMCGLIFKSETYLWVEGASSSSVYILAVPLVYCSCDNRPPNRRPTMSAGFAPGEHTAAELLEDELLDELQV